MRQGKNAARLSVCALILATAGGCGSDAPAPTGPTPGIPARLTAPTPVTPSDGEQLSTLRPTFEVNNGTSDQPGTRTYEFQISDRSDFSTVRPSAFGNTYFVVVSKPGVAEGANGKTGFTLEEDLQPTTRFYWRARTVQGSATSEWGPMRTFKTKLVGFIRAGEVYDPLIHGETVGTPVGSTSFVPGKGIRIGDENSFVRYQLPQTISSGEFSMEVEGLYPNNPGSKAKVFSMMDGGDNLYTSKFLLNAQYRGDRGNPTNCIAFKAVFGDEDHKLEPDLGRRTASVVFLDPGRTYFWKGTWGNEFRLVVLDGGIGGGVIYDYGISTTGTYNPSPHVAYLGANNGQFNNESGSWAGATYRNVWIGNRPRPASLGSALDRP